MKAFTNSTIGILGIILQVAPAWASVSEAAARVRDELAPLCRLEQGLPAEQVCRFKASYEAFCPVLAERLVTFDERRRYTPAQLFEIFHVVKDLTDLTETCGNTDFKLAPESVALRATLQDALKKLAVSASQVIVASCALFKPLRELGESTLTLGAYLTLVDWEINVPDLEIAIPMMDMVIKGAALLDHETRDSLTKAVASALQTTRTNQSRLTALKKEVDESRRFSSRLPLKMFNPKTLHRSALRKLTAIEQLLSGYNASLLELSP